MNRSEGLVQRRTATAQATSSGGATRSNGVDGDDNENSTAIFENDADSKDTRLTLMEEVLLLGLKDKEVCMRQIRIECDLIHVSKLGIYFFLE